MARSNSYLFDLPVVPFSSIIKDEITLNKIIGSPRTNSINALILHHTDTKSKEEYIKDSLNFGFMVHFIVGKDAKYYGWSTNPYLTLKAVPKMDDVSLHISIEGTEEEILKNANQLESAGKLFKKLSDDLEIPFSNENVGSRSGVFTHIQAKKKFGNFVDLKECGSEKILKQIMGKFSGKYFDEENWVGRFEKDWTARRENRIKKVPEPDFDRGRGIRPREK